MKTDEINIRDPFVLEKDGLFYLYGTRAKNFGVNVCGFDVYVSSDLQNWSEPKPCFFANEFDLEEGVCWAPEVHFYEGKFFMLATFTQKNDLRGTYILISESPEGPFVPHSRGAVTPHDWECLDGTLFVENETPYLIFCHEHTQIIDGTICFVELSPDLTKASGKPVELFCASSFAPACIGKKRGDHFITDGPFIYKMQNGRLLLLWSTFIKGKYAECLAEFENGSIFGKTTHLEPLIKDDGGHGMIFKANGKLFLSFHTPNETGRERPKFLEIEEFSGGLRLTK